MRAGEDMRALVVTHLSVMNGWARRLCRGGVDADDVVQEAILRALETEHPPRDPNRIRAWLCRIVHNTFVDAARLRARRREEALVVDPPSPPAEEVASWRDVGADDVRAAVDQLADHLRVTYSMYELEGRTVADIAAALAIRTATVGTRVLRARRRLRVLLAPAAV